MVRVKRGYVARRRRRKLLRRAKGFRGSLRKLFRPAKQAVIKALRYATRDRKRRKREMRKLWIARIAIAAKERGLSYNKFMRGLKKAGISLDRKNLADLAVSDPEAFSKLIEMIKSGQP